MPKIRLSPYPQSGLFVKKSAQSEGDVIGKYTESATWFFAFTSVFMVQDWHIVYGIMVQDWHISLSRWYKIVT